MDLTIGNDYKHARDIREGLAVAAGAAIVYRGNPIDKRLSSLTAMHARLREVKVRVDKLTDQNLEELGFLKNENGIWLIPLWLHPFVHEHSVIMDVNGDAGKFEDAKHVVECDAGMLPYGVATKGGFKYSGKRRVWNAVNPKSGEVTEENIVAPQPSTPVEAEGYKMTRKEGYVMKELPAPDYTGCPDKMPEGSGNFKYGEIKKAPHPDCLCSYYKEGRKCHHCRQEEYITRNKEMGGE